jgi:hypothetical protein
MMSNPLTEERLNQLKDDAVELLKNYGLLYLKNYGVAVFEKIKAELEPEAKSPWKLSHRPWDSVKRGAVFSGECFMKQGEGPGSFSSWKQLFIVERQDYNIDVYPDEKAYKATKPPTATIDIAGYEVVTDVSAYYHAELRKISEPLGMSESEVDSLTTFSRYSFALAHPQRINYIFQLHKSKESSCSCFGGSAVEPEDAGSEKREEIVKYVDAMKKLTTKVTPRGEDVVNKAFDLTCQQISRKVDSLSNWDDNGMEGQMLVDMLMEALLPGLRDDILRELNGPPSMKLKLWYKTQTVIQKTLIKVAEPGWAKIQQGAAEIQTRIEPVIRPAVGKILEIKGKVDEKLKAQTGDKLGQFLGKHVTPFVKPIINAFEAPLKKGFENGKNVFDQKVSLLELPDDANELEELLDSVARQSDNVSDVLSAAADVVEPLNELKSLSRDVFDGLEPSAFRTKAEQLLLEAIDAAAFSVKVRLETGQTKDDQLKIQILADYDYDTTVMRCEFVKTVARQLLIGAFKKLTAPVTQPAIDTANNVIPEEMQDFLNVESLLDRFIDTFVGSAIDKIVEPAFPRP